jgi:hypothetical protein
MFSADMQIRELDHPAEFDTLFPSGGYGTHGKGISYIFSDEKHGIPSGPPIPKDMPDDYPWDPSTGMGNPGSDILVLNDQVDWTEKARQNIQNAVSQKKGFVILHHALGDNQNWPWWYEEVTGGLLVLDDQSGKPKSSFSARNSVDVELLGDHPILTGIRPFRLNEESVYHRLWRSPKISPLAVTRDTEGSHPVAWIGPSTTARVVCIQLGSSTDTFRNVNYRKLVRNSILWCAGRL